LSSKHCNNFLSFNILYDNIAKRHKEKRHNEVFAKPERGINGKRQNGVFVKPERGINGKRQKGKGHKRREA
jgi:hypothetical protein